MGIHPVGENGAWIALPTFSTDRLDGAKCLPRIAEQIPSLRDKEFIVLDLRHNQCLSTKWSRKILSELELYNGTLYVIADERCGLSIPNTVRLNPPVQSQQALEDWVLANNRLRGH